MRNGWRKGRVFKAWQGLLDCLLPSREGHREFGTTDKGPGKKLRGRLDAVDGGSFAGLNQERVSVSDLLDLCSVTMS